MYTENAIIFFLSDTLDYVAATRQAPTDKSNEFSDLDRESVVPLGQRRNI